MPESRGPSSSPPARVTSADIPAPAQPNRSDEELERFYLEYFLPLVRRAIRRYGFSVQDAHDLAQDTFILAIAKMDAAKNPRAWLYQVLDHLCANFQRKAVRRAKLMAIWTPSATFGRRAREGSVDEP